MYFGRIPYTYLVVLLYKVLQIFLNIPIVSKLITGLVIMVTGIIQCLIAT